MISFILARFTMFVAVALNGLLTVYFWILIIAAVLSWVNPDPYNPIVRFLRSVTDPVLDQIVVTGAILATMYIGVQSGHVLAAEGGRRPPSALQSRHAHWNY